MPRPHMTIRRWMIITAFIALVCWAMSGEPLFVTVSATTGGLFGLGAIHHPWFFLAMAVSLSLLLPSACGSAANDFLAGCCLIGWLLGAIASMIIRCVKRGKMGT